MGTMRVLLLLWLVACSSIPVAISTTQARPDARVTIIELFAKYDVVGLSELHANNEIHAFLRSLIADPQLIERGVRNVVVEFGNARLQEVADRYVRGEVVSDAELRTIWRETGQFFVWDSAVYEQFFRAVRAINVRLPPEKKLRVLLGDQPIDWSRVHSAEDYALYNSDRDKGLADVIEKEVLARHQKALVIAGGMHFLYPRSATAGDPWSTSAGALLHARYLDRVFMFWFVSKPLGGPGGAPDAVVARGTPLGTTAFGMYAPQDVLVCKKVDGKPQCGPIAESDWPSVAEMTDGLIYYGPTPTTVEADPATYKDRAYVDELRRRAAIVGREDVVKELDELPR